MDLTVGKTNSIGMMLGLISPTSGQIFIDGINLEPSSRIKLLSLMNLHLILNCQKSLL